MKAISIPLVAKNKSTCTLWAVKKFPTGLMTIILGMKPNLVQILFLLLHVLLKF